MKNEGTYLTATYRTLSSVSALKTRSGKTLIKLEENSLSSKTESLNEVEDFFSDFVWYLKQSSAYDNKYW